jgi:long-subunit fatty acid transport protein
MINSNTDVDGIYLSAGLQYFTNIRNNHTLGIGLVYENSAYIWARQSDLVYNYSGLGANKTLNDTVKYMSNRTNMQLPQTIGGGLSYQYKKQWWFTADVTWQNWTKYRLDGNKDNSLQDAISTSFGVQVIPNIDASSYLKKIRIRAGVRYSTGYLVVNDKTIDSYGVSFGLDFPLKLFNSNSTLGVMAEYGQMGTIKNELLKENYFRFSFHFTLQERWYQRAKLE